MEYRRKIEHNKKKISGCHLLNVGYNIWDFDKAEWLVWDGRCSSDGDKDPITRRMICGDYAIIYSVMGDTGAAAFRKNENSYERNMECKWITRKFE